MKKEVLQDICETLQLKIVIYSLQLRVYQKEELSIVFSTLHMETYRKYILQHIWRKIKEYQKISSEKKMRQNFYRDHLD